MLTSKSCELFNIPYFQFSQLKKYCPELITQIKQDYKLAWNDWKQTILQVSQQLGQPFVEPHIEKWCNGWQMRAHFFAYFKYEFNQNSAAIFSVILNHRRLKVCLDWHCYRADRSQINVQQYNQWLNQFDFKRFSNFDIWHCNESEYDDFRQVKQLSPSTLILQSEEDYWCIGQNIEAKDLNNIDAVEFITQTIRDLVPLYERCHC